MGVPEAPSRLNIWYGWPRWCHGHDLDGGAHLTRLAELHPDCLGVQGITRDITGW
jgi:hypothetical protein